jgi:uncharacterized membrane protein YqhA
VPFLVQLLELVDKIMVANLVIMVLIGGYENLFPACRSPIRKKGSDGWVSWTLAR